eukprot:c23844_g1_i2 orf=1144-2028(-)
MALQEGPVSPSDVELVTVVASVDREQHVEGVEKSAVCCNKEEEVLGRSDPRVQESSVSVGGVVPLRTLALSSMVAAGVQFGWALQLSLLTPYIQTLGIEHSFSSFIWLCGPVTGLVVQPCVGAWSDKCKLKYGRRRPFILAGVFLICLAVISIGFAADIGYLLGDTREHCQTFRGTRVWAAVVFVLGFWLLDLANNTVQGPARALLADLSSSEQRDSANAIFCLWIALGNILGFSAGASGQWHKWFPFVTSRACCEACGNLKAAFLVAVLSHCGLQMRLHCWLNQNNQRIVRHC